MILSDQAHEVHYSSCLLAPISQRSPHLLASQFEGTFRTLRCHASTEPESYPSRIAKRVNIWWTMYKTGPPYWRVPPGYEANSLPSHVVEKMLRATNIARIKLPIGVIREIVKWLMRRYESILLTGCMAFNLWSKRLRRGYLSRTWGAEIPNQIC